MGKTAVREIAQKHFETLVDGRTGKVSKADWTFSVGVPVIVGVVAPVLSFRLPSGSGAIDAAAILTGLLFGLVVFIFQVRLTIKADPVKSQYGALTDSVDALFQNVLYAILVGLLWTIVSVAADAFTIRRGEYLTGWATGAVTAVGLHLAWVVLMCLKRVMRAYMAMSR